jgi:hypothetical protein
MNGPRECRSDPYKNAAESASWRRRDIPVTAGVPKAKGRLSENLQLVGQLLLESRESHVSLQAGNGKGKEA